MHFCIWSGFAHLQAASHVKLENNEKSKFAPMTVFRGFVNAGIIRECLLMDIHGFALR